MNGLPSVNPSSVDFDRLYTVNDPWKVMQSPWFSVHVELVRRLTKDYSFSRGIDIGCGAGVFTSALHIAEDMDAGDFSSQAILKAKNLGTDIKFKLLDMRQLELIESNMYDIVTCFESLYYLEGEDLQRKFLKELARISRENAIFLISFVTNGDKTARKYFSYFTGVSILSETFEILDTHNWTLHENQFRLHQKILKKLLSHNTSLQTRYLIYLMGKSRREDSFQTLFRCRVKVNM